MTTQPQLAEWIEKGLQLAEESKEVGLEKRSNGSVRASANGLALIGKVGDANEAVGLFIKNEWYVKPGMEKFLGISVCVDAHLAWLHSTHYKNLSAREIINLLKENKVPETWKS